MMNSQKHLQDDADEDETLNRLYSDLSSLFLQIDELVAKAFGLKEVSKEGRIKIESFSHVLSDMLSCFKPWVPKLQIALSSLSVESESRNENASCEEGNVSECDSPQEITLDSLVSPSPLVSWRANCTVDRGRQMFMLTPLPLSRAMSTKLKQQAPKSEFNELASSTYGIETSTFLALSRDMNTLLDSVVMKEASTKPAPSSLADEEASKQEPGLASSPIVPNRDTSMIVMMTPCLKMSPPRSCVLLEPISEIHHRGIDKVRKCTPFPVGVHYSDSEDSESPGDEASRGFALRYPELLGLQQVSKSAFGKKEVESSPDWLTSPPKTCVLLEPPDDSSSSLELEKDDNESCIQITDSVLKQPFSKLKDDVSKDHNQAKKSCDQDHSVGNSLHIESTPMWQEPESSFRTGKRPGENTLKKELWSKFEAATIGGFQPELTTVRENTRKGFLDLLEEASDEQ